MIHLPEQSIIKELDGITSATKHGLFVSRRAATKIVGLLMGLYQVTSTQSMRKRRALKKSILVGTSSKTIHLTQLGHTDTAAVDEQAEKMASFTTMEAENCGAKEANFNVEKPSSSAGRLYEYYSVMKETNVASDDEEVLYYVEPISVYFPTTTAVPSNTLNIRKQTSLKESVLVGTSSMTIRHSELGHTDTESVDEFYSHELSTKKFRSMVQVIEFIKSKSYPTEKNKGTLEDSKETSTSNNNTPVHGQEGHEYIFEELKDFDKFEDFESYFDVEKEPTAAVETE